MTKRRKGDLDRSSLFQSILGEIGAETGNDPAGNLIDISLLRYNPEQPRRHFDDDALEQLAASIRQHGVLEPVLVRRTGVHFELIAGERRSRAARLAGLNTIPAIVLEVDGNAALEISIMENLQREDLNAVEETDAVLQLLQLSLELEREQVVRLLQEIYNEERGRSSGGDPSTENDRTQVKELFTRLGRFTPSSFYVNRVPILSFPDDLLEAVRSGKLSFTKAQLIARIPDEAQRRELLRQALVEDLTVSQLRTRAARLKTSAASGSSQSADKVLARTRRLLSLSRLERLPAHDRARAELLLKELRELLET
jgi:ParB family chromosome partitioning protein